MVVENEIIIKQRRNNKTAGSFKKFRAGAGYICRNKRYQSKEPPVLQDKYKTEGSHFMRI